jgi:hypothetical protein
MAIVEAPSRLEESGDTVTHYVRLQRILASVPISRGGGIHHRY